MLNARQAQANRRSARGLIQNGSFSARQEKMMPEVPPRHVFVYGTLRRGGRNDINGLEPAPRYVGMGEVKGTLYHLDWYPGLTLGGEEAVTVVGEVYEIEPRL